MLGLIVGWATVVRADERADRVERVGTKISAVADRAAKLKESVHFRLPATHPAKLTRDEEEKLINQGLAEMEFRQMMCTLWEITAYGAPILKYGPMELPYHAEEVCEEIPEMEHFDARGALRGVGSIHARIEHRSDQDRVYLDRDRGDARACCVSGTDRPDRLSNRNTQHLGGREKRISSGHDNMVQRGEGPSCLGLGGDAPGALEWRAVQAPLWRASCFHNLTGTRSGQAPRQRSCANSACGVFLLS